ncbi:hypothetical protein BUALT_Bualt19G0021400 [Buddleja alternifolia]|uniref:Protein FAR1-RELATED SEQUENCE n=1 Tax=Buddleja alternifolia TaxID=168488 RepID=A0AAV6W1F5_9LAMI|nr:hypothetical protein BUALT_Bualt19G0021400 [Buddleja alternifolia]
MAALAVDFKNHNQKESRPTKKTTQNKDRIESGMDEDIVLIDNPTSCRRLDFDNEEDVSDGLHEKNKGEEVETDGFEDGEKTINDRHAIIPKEKIPTTGMEFDNEETAYEFYNEYVSATGFSIRKFAVHKDTNDGEMIVDYMHFGDVVCFDTTYKKNKEGRKFAFFVGVNHHKQTVIFGADETAQTFMWIFGTFTRCMSGKKPETILVDQDAAMAKALAERCPTTYHRLCIWKIYRNAAIHLSSVFANFRDFSRDFSSCIYDYEEEDDFIDAWNEMLKKYNLQDNDWLERMLKIKEKWAHVCGGQTFCADMTTTQRSDSMNTVLKKMLITNMTCYNFFTTFID